MSKLYSVKRFGVFLLEILWMLLSVLYRPVRLMLLILGGAAGALFGFYWMFGALWNVPAVRHDAGLWFWWTFGGSLLLLVLGDLLFRRKSK